MLSILSQALRRHKHLRMNRRCQRMQALHQRARGRVQKLIVDAVHSPVFCGFGLLPPALGDDLFQRHTISGAAPRGHNHVRIGGGYFFFRRMFSRLAKEASAGGFHQFRHPCLRKNQRLAPLFAINQRPLRARRPLPHGLDLLFHPCHQRLCLAATAPRASNPMIRAIIMMSL